MIMDTTYFVFPPDDYSVSTDCILLSQLAIVLRLHSLEPFAIGYQNEISTIGKPFKSISKLYIYYGHVV